VCRKTQSCLPENSSFPNSDADLLVRQHQEEDIIRPDETLKLGGH